MAFREGSLGTGSGAVLGFVNAISPQPCCSQLIEALTEWAPRAEFISFLSSPFLYCIRGLAAQLRLIVVLLSQAPQH